MSRIENEVSRKLIGRAEAGLAKYGVTMERSDLLTRDWLIHAQEEAMDLAVYLERLIQEYDDAHQGPSAEHAEVGQRAKRKR